MVTSCSGRNRLSENFKRRQLLPTLESPTIIYLKRYLYDIYKLLTINKIFTTIPINNNELIIILPLFFPHQTELGNWFCNFANNLFSSFVTHTLMAHILCRRNHQCFYWVIVSFGPTLQNQLLSKDHLRSARLSLDTRAKYTFLCIDQHWSRIQVCARNLKMLVRFASDNINFTFCWLQETIGGR